MDSRNRTTTPCPICNHPGTHPFRQLKHGRVINRCGSCGLVFATPLWTSAEADTVFANYQGWPEGISGGVSDRSAGMAQIARQIQMHWRDRATSTPGLLDIGCADGEFFRVMAATQDGFQFSGVEPDPKWQQHDYGNARVYPVTLRQCQFPDAHFDVVTILDAFCYFPDPKAHVEEIMRILKPGGLFVFDIPGQVYLRLRGLVGSWFRLGRTQTFAAYPYYYAHPSVLALLAGTPHQIEAIVVDRGTVQDHPWLKAGLQGYTGIIKRGADQIASLREFAPKLIYLIRKA